MVPWAPCNRRGGVAGLIATCGRRGGLAGFLGPVWPPWGVAVPLGPVWAPWGRGRSPGPGVVAVGFVAGLLETVWFRGDVDGFMCAV